MEQWDYFTLSHTGRRNGNEDNCLAESFGNNTWLFVVADGMGGASEGETASSLAVSSLFDYLQNQFSDQDNKDIPDLKSMLNNAFLVAQQTILDYIRVNDLSKGMGTTLVALLVYNDLYVWGNIGDSRLYIVDGDDMTLLSRDHTHVQDYHEKNGKPATPEMVKQYGHILTRALDGGTDNPDIYPSMEPYLRLTQGDTFMLCSDGLFSNKYNVNTRMIRNYILGTSTLEIAGRNLISGAYMAGSQDNITLVLVCYGILNRINLNLQTFEWPPELNEVIVQQAASRQSRKKRWIRTLLILIPLFIAGLCLLLSLLGFCRLFD